MSKFIKSILSISMLALMALSSCSSSNSSSVSKVNDDAAFITYTDTRDFLYDAEQFGKLMPSYKLILPDKGLAINFSVLAIQDGVIQDCRLGIGAFDQNDGQYTEFPVSMGRLKKRGGELTIEDFPENYRTMVSRYAANHDGSSVAMKGIHDQSPASVFYYFKNDTILDMLKNLIDHPQFVTLKQYIDNYERPIFNVPADPRNGSWQYLNMPKFYLSDNGIDGVITLGMPVGDIPSKVEYLYDNIAKTKEANEMEDEEYTALSFTLDGEETMSGISFDGNTLDILSVTAPNVGVGEKGRYTVKVGDRPSGSGAKYNEETGMFEKGNILINLNDKGRIFNFQLGSW